MPLVYNSDEDYHASPGISKTGLWTIYTKTPAHFRYGTKPSKPEFDIGKAAHIAILEPNKLEPTVMKGPADRRGNKWKEAQDEADHFGKLLLTASDYEMALLIRDVAATVPQVQIMQSGEYINEASAYHVDEETGVTVRCKPDIYNKTHRLIGDVKNMTDASLNAFSRSAGRYGYHVQDAIYTDVWSKGTGMDVDGFFFIVFEKSDPPLVACYELDAPSVEEGYAVYRKALAKYAECVATDTWPGYPDDIQRIGISRWDYRELPPPRGPESEMVDEGDEG